MLTDKKLQNLKATGQSYRVWDAGRRTDFGVEVSRKGSISFFQSYRQDGKRRYFTLGRYPDTKLKEARDLAKDVRKYIEKGRYPHDERDRLKKESKREKATAQRRGTVTKLFNEYMDSLEADGKRSVRQVKRIFKADVKPVIGDEKARDIQPDDIRGVLFPIIDRGAPILANRALAYLKAAFAFGIRWDQDPANYKTQMRFEIQVNPARDIPKPQKTEAPRDRYLSESEINLVWAGLGSVGMRNETGIALKLILATCGQRVEEVIHAEWSEFDLQAGFWELPPARTKSGRPHVVPLNSLALRLLDDLHKLTGEGIYLFPGAGDKDEEQPIRTSSLGYAVRRFCRRNTELAQDWQLVSANPDKYVRKYNFDDLRTKGGWPKEDSNMWSLRHAFAQKWRFSEWELQELDRNGWKDIKRFTPRDLRRTAKTQMARLGISKEIRDRLQNHSLQDVASKHYDRYDYLREKQAAAAAWGDWLEGVILVHLENPRPKGVVMNGWLSLS